MTERLAEIRGVFERHRKSLAEIYGLLDWEQKASLLRAMIEAGDHPPGFTVSFDVGRISEAELAFLRSVGIGPFDDEVPNEPR